MALLAPLRRKRAPAGSPAATPIHGRCWKCRGASTRKAPREAGSNGSHALIDREPGSTARGILSEEARFSDAIVPQELDRYTFRSSGQAGNHYDRYSELLDLRIEADLALGEAFDQQAFNDFSMGQGALPLDLLAEAVREDFVPPTTDPRLDAVAIDRMDVPAID